MYRLLLKWPLIEFYFIQAVTYASSLASLYNSSILALDRFSLFGDLIATAPSFLIFPVVTF